MSGIIRQQFPLGAQIVAQNSGLATRAAVPPTLSPRKPASAGPVPYGLPASVNAVQPTMANGARTFNPPVPPPVYRPQQGIVQNKPITAPPSPYRPQAAVTFKPPQVLAQNLVAPIQRNTPSHAGTASVVQCWFCYECRRHVRRSYHHRDTCSRYYLRTYETSDDQTANANRPAGAALTRSGSFRRTPTPGTAVRMHYHENIHSTGYEERQV
jgi:hypothetical protein